MNLRLFILLFVASLFFSGATPSCTGEDRTASKTGKTVAPKVEPKSLTMIKPAVSEKVILGEAFEFALKWRNTKGIIDSVEVFLDSMPAALFKSGELTGDIDTQGLQPGTRQIKAIVYHNSGKKESYISQILILSDVIPKNYSYSVVNTYPHDIGAYTQGFEFFDGFFYEGTGQYNESSIRKTDLLTGQILKARNLPGDLFGEGITILNNKIYQVTYRSQVGFVYDINTYEILQKIYYQNQEGWGLTNDGKSVIMSDGTNNLYFMDPEYFHVLRKIEVMDNNGPVNAINELEWIEGKIWANRYLTDEIVIIDPESGRVEAKMNLSGILHPDDRHPKIDVLNGIAWDKENRRLFVTGKYWPKIFEIKVIKSG